jgi:hypothetical protein
VLPVIRTLLDETGCGLLLDIRMHASPRITWA